MAIVEKLRSSVSILDRSERKVLTMVTTNSMTPDLNFRASDLVKSGSLEDMALFGTVFDSIKILLESLIPVINYVDKPLVWGAIRGVHVTGDLILSREGKWFYFRPSTREYVQDDKCWEFYVVQDIFLGLQRVLKEAVDKKTQHLEALNVRKKMLDDIVAVMQSANSQK